jgi:hypothetical protein
VNRQGNDRLAASLRRETVMKELLHTHYRAAGGQPTFASWNQIAAWLRQLDRLPRPVREGGDASSEGFDVRAKVECRPSGVTSPH